MFEKEGYVVCILGVFFFLSPPPPPVFVWIFSLSLLAFWLLVFLAFCLFGFLASWLSGFSASWLFGILLVYAAFGGFLALAFRILFFPNSSSAGDALTFTAFRWFMRLLAALAFRILCFPSSSPGVLAFAPFHGFFRFGFPHHQHHQLSPCLNHHFFEHHGRGSPPPTCYFVIVCRVVAHLFESTLLQTSWWGLPSTPNPRAIF